MLTALHLFCDEIAESNPHRDDKRHDALWSRLVREIRHDLDDPPTTRPETFVARLWVSGVPGHREQVGHRGADAP